MLNYVYVKEVGPASELNLEFAPRLNLLTGDNGLGKSFILDIAWWALTGTWPGQQALPREDAQVALIRGVVEGRERTAEYYFPDERWRSAGSPNPISHGIVVLYARVDDGFSIWDSIRNYPGPKGRPPSELAYNFSQETLWNGLSNNGLSLCEGLIRDWVSWQNQGTEAFERLQTILEVLSPEGEGLRPGEPTRVSLADVRSHPTLEMPYGKIPLILASAGMKRILSLAYLLVWAWQEHLQAANLLRRSTAYRIIFLVDEIESHLHPKWQRLILPALLQVVGRLGREINVQVLVTTHSPLVLASVEPFFDEAKDALFTFDLEGRDVKVSRADWRSRGDASSWLTSDVFDLGEARSVQAEQVIQRAKEAMRNPNLPIEEKRRIHHELRTVLKDTDPFWGRWLVQAKAAGIEP